jgi:hypothetical protein
MAQHEQKVTGSMNKSTFSFFKRVYRTEATPDCNNVEAMLQKARNNL